MSWAEVKHALNSTLGTDDFKPLDKMISGNIVIIKENTTWSIPKGIDVVYITACGGGGGGGNSPSTYNDHPLCDGGAGGACIVDKMFDVSGLTQLNITIGKGGKGGAYESPGNVPENGEATVIGDLVTLPGGTKAAYATRGYRAEGTYPGGGYGGKSKQDYQTGSLSEILGGAGAYIDGVRVGDYSSIYGDGDELNSNYFYGGCGGSSLGVGGDGIVVRNRDMISEATDGGYGAGGGGGYSYIGDGGNGGDGIVIIRW